MSEPIRRDQFRRPLCLPIAGRKPARGGATASGCAAIFCAIWAGILLAAGSARAAEAAGNSADHWSYKPLVRPAVPDVSGSRFRGWVRTPIDAFILAELESRGMYPSPPADKRTLLRRVYFDLTGLSPTPQDVSAFLADPSSDAYQKVVDRLLAS